MNSSNVLITLWWQLFHDSDCIIKNILQRISLMSMHMRRHTDIMAFPVLLLGLEHALDLLQQDI